ncbi:MAG: GH92 family glycosyl hydrolase [Acidobacteriaceae bacterium]
MKYSCIAALLISCVCVAQSVDLASKVNPSIGTSAALTKGETVPRIDQYGNTVPGAVRPFGMLYWGPDAVNPVPGNRNNFYRFDDTSTRGFGLTHLSGPGCSIYGEVPILPMLGIPSEPPPWEPAPYQAKFNPDDQAAEPGYYAVKLSSGIHVQLAAALRSGIAEIQFPATGGAHTILVDLSRNLIRVNDAEVHLQGRTITGSVTGGEMCGKQNHYRVYFVLQVEEEPAKVGTFNEIEVTDGNGSRRGTNSGAYISFPQAMRVVHVKVAISFVSMANARLNLIQEIPGWDFETVRRDARAAWNQALGHVQVRGGTEVQQKIFYTALYHALLHPSTFSDVNGEYLGFDEHLHHARGRIQYANYSGWDIYRCQVQLITMLMPKVGSDMAQSLVADAEQGGGLPIWSMANEEGGFMVGDSSDLMLASIYAFGGREFDTKAALKAMLHGANDPDAHSQWDVERPNLKEYLRQGFLAEDAANPYGAASITLEYANADFAISQFAEALGDTATVQTFLKRSANWRTIFDPDTRYIRPRDKDGKFLADFNPGNGVGFVEGNSAQYTWMVPYDLSGVIADVGGPEEANARLDQYFSQYGTWRGGPYFLIENEPSFCDPWIYNWTGRPWRAQELVRKTLIDLFTDARGGIPGNDDLGATSAWAVFAQLGIYPEIPGVGGFTLNSPIFPEVTLKLGTHEISILANGAPDKVYVKKIALDDKPIRNWWIPWSEFSQAKQLDFTLSAVPEKAAGHIPPSFAPPEHESRLLHPAVDQAFQASER